MSATAIPAIAVTALASFEKAVGSTLVEFAEKQCGGLFPVRVLQGETEARAWWPGSLLAFRDGGFGFTPLQNAVIRDSTSGQLKFAVTKFGAEKAVRMSVSAITESVESCILGVLCSPGGPNAANFKAGKASPRVQHEGTVHYIAALTSADHEGPALSVHSGVGTNAVGEALPLLEALARYELAWVYMLATPPSQVPQAMQQIDPDTQGPMVVDWVHLKVRQRIRDDAEPDLIDDGEVDRRAALDASTHYSERASADAYAILERFKLEAPGSQSIPVTLSRLASFVCTLAAQTPWTQVGMWVIASGGRPMYDLLEALDTLSAFVPQEAIDEAYGVALEADTALDTVDEAVAAAWALRTRLLPAAPPPAPAIAAEAEEPTERGGQQAQQGRQQPQQGQQPVVNLYQQAPRMAAGGQGEAQAPAAQGAGRVAMATGQALLPRGVGQPGMPPPPFPPPPAGARYGTPVQTARAPQSGDATPRGESAGHPTLARLGTDVCRQFAPKAPAASPLTDVRTWVDMLGGEPVQRELAALAGKKLRPHLSPLDGVHAAVMTFSHLLETFTKLVDSDGWCAGLAAPDSWDVAKERLAEFLDEADGLAARPGPTPGPLGAATHPPTGDPSLAEAFSGLKESLEKGLGGGLRKAFKKDPSTEGGYLAVAPKEVIKARAACTAEVARPICSEQVVLYESTLGSGLSRRVKPADEVARFTTDKRVDVAQAARALFQSANLVTEKAGAAPVNVVDAVSAARLLLRTEVRKARGGPFQRPDVMTPERLKKCDALAEGIARGDIDFDPMVEMLGGVAPNRHRAMAGEDRAQGMDGNPKDRNDIRDAVDVLVRLLVVWWGDVLFIDPGADEDFGIKSTLKANKDLLLPALRTLMQSGFANTRECFMQDRETPQRKPPDVLGAWDDADRYDAGPLAEDQKVRAATLAHAEAQCKQLLAPMEKKLKEQQEKHSKELAELRRKCAEPPGTAQVGNKKRTRFDVGPDDATPDDAAVDDVAAKRRKQQEEERHKSLATPAQGGTLPPLPNTPIDSRGDLFTHLGATLRGGCPRGEWPCLTVMLFGKCKGAPDCRSCSKSKTGGKGEDDTRLVVIGRLKELLKSKKLSGEALKMAKDSPSCS